MAALKILKMNGIKNEKMSKTHNLTKEIIESWKYKVLEDDGEHIVVRYQMNAIHICPNEEDDSFVTILLPIADDEVVEDNLSDEVLIRCHRLNEELKQVKFYVVKDVLVASSEFYYMGKEDLSFQLKKSFSNIVSAKVSYQNYDNLV